MTYPSHPLSYSRKFLWQTESALNVPKRFEKTTKVKLVGEKHFGPSLQAVNAKRSSGDHAKDNWGHFFQIFLVNISVSRKTSIR